MLQQPKILSTTGPPNKACTGPLLSFGHLPLKGKTQHWEYSGFEVFLLSSRVYGPHRRQVNANGVRLRVLLLSSRVHGPLWRQVNANR